VPDIGWLFTGRGPYVLSTKVDAAPGPVSFQLVEDLSLMRDEKIVLSLEATVAPDSTLTVKLGTLPPGFYQVRLRDSLRWNIGVRPEEVVSKPDAPDDFDAFWAATLSELAEIPLDASYTAVPEYSDDRCQCFEVRYSSLGGATVGGILSIPVAHELRDLQQSRQRGQAICVRAHMRSRDVAGSRLAAPAGRVLEPKAG